MIDSAGTAGDYTWSPNPQFQATWVNPPPDGSAVHLKLGDQLTLKYLETGDCDTCTWIGPPCDDMSINDQLICWDTLWSDCGSQYVRTGPLEFSYTAGNQYPSGARKGHDAMQVILDDVPLVKYPYGEGSRDDIIVSISRDKLFVHFPTCAIKTGQVGPTPTVGSGWQVDTTWTVVDQWGLALAGVTVSENPTNICQLSQNHSSGTHLYGVDLTGDPFVTDAAGNFPDQFGVAPGLALGKAVTFKQIYSGAYGTYSDPVLSKFRVKMINYRPDPAIVFDFSAEPWPDPSVNCAGNQ